jgi:hypothetical protein
MESRPQVPPSGQEVTAAVGSDDHQAVERSTKTVSIPPRPVIMQQDVSTPPQHDNCADCLHTTCPGMPCFAYAVTTSTELPSTAPCMLPASQHPCVCAALQRATSIWAVYMLAKCVLLMPHVEG